MSVPGVASGVAPGGEPAATPVRVLVADDQPLLRHSLALLIEADPGCTVVGAAGSGRETVALARELHPDVVIMDIRMPDGDGIAATGVITSDPDLGGCRVLVLSMFELDEYVFGALRAGASGFLLKDAHPDELREAIHRTHTGESLFAPAILTKLVEHFVAREPGVMGEPDPPGTPDPPRTADLPPITPRETEVLTLIGRGYSNTDIARALTISMGTVKTHVGNLLAKLHARDRAGLVIAAYESGQVVPEGEQAWVRPL